MATYVGDRAEWLLLNQRWDKPDPRMIQALLQKTMVRDFGNVYGPTWGVLTIPELDFSAYGATQRVIVGKCVFGYAWESTANGKYEFEGGPVIYDPSRPIQTESTISIPSAWGDPAQDVWLWFKRNEGFAAVDMRAFMPGSTEEVEATSTQYQEYVSFQATPLAGSPGITEANGWFRFARVPAENWVDGVPLLVEFIDFFDGWYLQGMTSEAMSAQNRFGALFQPNNEAATADSRWGLAPKLQAMLNQLAILLDTNNFRDDATNAAQGDNVEAGSYHWFDRPARGLKQINEIIDSGAITPQIIVGQYDININGLTGGFSYQAGYAAVSLPVVSNRFSMFIDVPDGFKITAVQVTQTIGDLGAITVVPTLAVHWESAMPFSGPATQGLDIEAWAPNPAASINTFQKWPFSAHVTVFGEPV